MTVRSTARRAAALAAALAFVGAGAASAAPRTVVPHAADKPGDRVTFGIGPGGQAFVDRRSFVSYAAPPGGQLLDRVAIYNQSDQPLDLLVYSSDAENTRSGELAITPRDQQNHDLGAWVLVGQAAETGTLAVNARSMIRVHVPPQSPTTGVGRVVVPMRVVVPTDATPGDHVAGMVASLISRGNNPSSQNIELEQRVALRVYVQVSGELKPRLAVKILKADYVGGSGFGVNGTTRVTYQVRNTGNVRLGAIPVVSVKAPLGLHTWRASGAEVDELLPGGAAIQTTDVKGPWPTVVQRAAVDVTAKAVPGARLQRTPTAHDSIRVWAVTWQEVVTLLLVLAWLLYRRWRKAHPPKTKGKHVKEPAPDGPSAKAKVTAGAGVMAVVGMLLVGTGGKARAAELGPIEVAPLSGSDSTLFTGYVKETRCPKGTADSYWSIDGPDLPRDQAILAPGNTTGTGAQLFRNASIANLKALNSGAFSRSGSYTIRFNCVRSPDGTVSSTYQAELRYTAGGKGAFRIIGAKRVPDYVLDPQLSPAPKAVVTTSPAVGTGTTSPGATPGAAPSATPSSSAGTQPAVAPDSSPLAASDRGSAAGWWLALVGVPVALGAWALSRRSRGAAG
jgi:hypothetical protein